MDWKNCSTYKKETGTRQISFSNNISNVFALQLIVYQEQAVSPQSNH